MLYLFKIYVRWFLENFLKSQGRIQDNFWGVSIWSNYRTYSTYSYKQAWTYRVEPDQTPQNVASDQVLYCLPLTQQFILHTFISSISSSEYLG